MKYILMIILHLGSGTPTTVPYSNYDISIPKYGYTTIQECNNKMYSLLERNKIPNDAAMFCKELIEA